MRSLIEVQLQPKSLIKPLYSTQHLKEAQAKTLQP